MSALLIYDTETTGLTLHPDAPLAKQPSVIEFGAALVSLRDGKVLERYETLINPGKPLESIITKITGITDEMLAAAPMFEDAWKGMRKRFAKAQACLAHNEPFDHSLIDYELKRIGVGDFVWPRAFCTIGLYRNDFGYDPKLTVLYEHVLGKPLAQTHRAAEDVSALVEIVRAAEIWRVMK